MCSTKSRLSFQTCLSYSLVSHPSDNLVGVVGVAPPKGLLQYFIIHYTTTCPHLAQYRAGNYPGKH